MAGRHPQSPAQAIAALSNDLVSGHVHNHQKTPWLHFQTLELSDELMEAWRSRFPCPAGVIGCTVVGKAENPAMEKTGRIMFHFPVEKLDQGAQLSSVGGLRLCP